jgi:hypothetical protein
MPNIVSKPDQLREYQCQFVNDLKNATGEQIKCSIACLPRGALAEVEWLARPGIWFYAQEIESMWWNAFGIGRPAQGEEASITCEINIPKYGINRRAAGGFIEDGSKVYVVHRGNQYGGGKPGMTKGHFWQNYYGRCRTIDDGDCVTEVAIIGELGTRRLALDIASFVNWIRGIQFAALVQVLSEQEHELRNNQQQWVASDESFKARIQQLQDRRESLVAGLQSAAGQEKEAIRREILGLEKSLKAEQDSWSAELERRRQFYNQLVDKCFKISNLAVEIGRKRETTGRLYREEKLNSQMESDYYRNLRADYLRKVELYRSCSDGLRS